MRSPKEATAAWLDRPQKTNRDALVVGIIGGLAVTGVGYGVPALLAALNVADFQGSIPVWIAAVAAGALLGFGLLLGGRGKRREEELRSELGAYEVYAEHIRDALADLRRVIAGELPAFSLRDFVEGGLFVTAQRLLGRTPSRGEIRLSILHPDNGDFVMASDDAGLFPALGHTPEGRQNFRMPITDSFSVHAFRKGKVFASGRLSDDDRFQAHPKAKRPYESIVSVPLWMDGRIDGVLNVVATADNAFSAVERTYIAVLGSVIDVARAAAERQQTSVRRVGTSGQVRSEPDDKLT